MTSQLCSVSVRSRAGATEFESTVMKLSLYVLLHELLFICMAM